MTIDVLKTVPKSKCNSEMINSLRRSHSSVRRSLFGEVDHEESMSFLKKELDAIAESEKKRWNFDFVNEKPLESSEYEWTPVMPDEIVPRPYALSRLPYLYKHTEKSCSDKQDRLSDRLTKVEEVTISKTKLKQTLIDGYMKARKRPVCLPKETCCKETSDCTCQPSKRVCLTSRKND